MKTRTRLNVISMFFAVVIIGALVIINRNSNLEREKLANAKQLQIVVNNEEKVYPYLEDGGEYVTFNTQMKRRNGDVFEKNYSGIELGYILARMEIDLKDSSAITVVCADNYEIRLTKTEIETPGNIYLVTREDGRPLAEGSFMLVVNFDEFSTRWAKNVVQVKIN